MDGGLEYDLFNESKHSNHSILSRKSSQWTKKRHSKSKIKKKLNLNNMQNPKHSQKSENLRSVKKKLLSNAIQKSRSISLLSIKSKSNVVSCKVSPRRGNKFKKINFKSKNKAKKARKKGKTDEVNGLRQSKSRGSLPLVNDELMTFNSLQ